MKKNILIKAAAMAIVSGAMLSCSGTKEVKFDTVGTSETYALVEGGKDSLHIDVSLQMPSEGLDKEVRERIGDSILIDALGENAEGKSAEEAIKGYAADRLKDYRETNLEFLGTEEKDSDGEDDGDWGIFTWNFEVEGRYEGEYNGWMSYSLTSYTYTGGAHGGTSISGLNFDRKTGDTLSEDDIFAYGYEERLSDALRSHLKSSLPTEDYDMLFDTDITPNGNFILSKAGITYIYGQYEIGPYVCGIIKVTVPWEEIQSLLK